MDTQTNRRVLLQPLLACGFLSSLVYVMTDILGALSYPGYDYASQAISEMSAIGAPTAPLLEPLYLAYALLFTAFGLGVWAFGRYASGLRIAGPLIVAVGLLGLFAWPFFPMHVRGADRSFTDTMHLALGAVDVLLLGLAIAFGSGAFGRGFRNYSWATIGVMVIAGGLTAFYVPRVDAGLPTAGLGILERTSLAAYLLWIAILSGGLLKLSWTASHAPARKLA